MVISFAFSSSNIYIYPSLRSGAPNCNKWTEKEKEDFFSWFRNSKLSVMSV